MKFVKNISAKKSQGQPGLKGTLFLDSAIEAHGQFTAYGRRIKKDSFGNSYVLGLLDAGTNIDGQEVLGSGATAVLMKYNSDGVKQWTKTVGIKNRTLDINGLSVDSSGNVCIVGFIGWAENNLNFLRAEPSVDYPELTVSESKGYQEGFVVKFDTSGNKVFAKLLDISKNTSELRGVDFDSSGNVYVTGFVGDGSLNGVAAVGPQDAIIVKYDPSGNVLATKRLGAASTWLYMRGMNIDSLGNIHIFGDVNVGAGNSFLGNTQLGTLDSIIIKLDSSMNVIWSKMLGGSGFATYLVRGCLDSSNNIYLVGDTYGNLDGQTLTGTTDSVLVKYDSNGNKEFTKLLGASAAYSRNTGVGLDSLGNIYLTGDSAGNFDGLTKNSTGSNRDIFIVKRDSSGNKIWTKLLGNYAGSSNGEDLFVDSTDGPVICGTYPQNLDGKQKKQSRDILIAKHDSSGNRIWSDLSGVNNLASGNDVVQQIAVDSSGNIYCSGDTTGNMYNTQRVGARDAFLIKYNSSKVIQWVKSIGISGQNTLGYGCTVDSSGNVYVCGNTGGNLANVTKIGTLDLFVQKYNSNGVLQWTRLLGTASATVVAYRLAIDSSNNIYVAGETSHNLDGQTKTGTVDAVLVKYDSSGNKIFTKLLGVASQTTKAKDVIVHSSGNIYIAGTTTGNLSGQTKNGTQDLFLAKYNSSGVIQWTRLTGNSGGTANFNSGLKVNSSEEIYVSGEINTNLDGQTKSGTVDNFIVKYNSSGTKQWTRLLGTSGSTMSAYGGALDSSENYYITGVAGYNSVSYRFENKNLFGDSVLLAKYDSNGNKIMTNIYGHYNGAAMGSDLVISGDRIFINSRFERNTFEPIDRWRNQGLIEFDKQGNRRSVSTTKNSLKSASDNYVNSKLIDSQNNLYICGSTFGANIDGVTAERVGQWTGYIIKYDSLKQKLWTKQIANKDATGGVQIFDIKKDSQNNLYVAGITQQVSLNNQARIGTQDAILVKLDSNGNEIWTRTIGAASGTLSAYKIQISSNDNIYIHGNVNVTLDGQAKIGTRDGFLIKYNSSGTKQWTKLYGNSSATVTSGNIVIDSSENIYINGIINTNLDGQTKTGTNDSFLIKYNSSGTKQWTKLLGVSANSTYSYYGLCIDSSYIYMVGYTTGNLSGQTKNGTQDLFLAKYDFNGNLQSVRLVGFSGVTITNLTATMYKDNIYCSNFVIGTGLSIDGSPILAPTGYRDFLLIKIDKSGNKKWAKLNNSTDSAVPNTIFFATTPVVDNYGNILVERLVTGISTVLDQTIATSPSILHYRSNGLWRNVSSLIFTINEQGELI